MRFTLPILAIAVAGAAACGPRQAAPAASAPVVVAAPPVPAEPAAAGKPATHRSLASIGLDPGALDRSADPCDDFYQFACGGWIKATEIPADKPVAMRSFVDIADRNLAYEHAMLERARTRPGDDPAARQLGVFYGSCMNEPAIEAAGLTALRPLLAAIDRVNDPRSLTRAIAMLQASGIDALFALGPTQDSVDARNVIANIDQGGIGMPDRDYYLKDDETTRSLRGMYQAYVESVLVALGHKAARREAADVVAFETEIAKISKDRAARRDPRGTYNKIDRAGVARAMPSLDWDAFWTAVGLKDITDVTVTSPELLAGLERLLGATRPAIWRVYLASQLAGRTAPMLTKPLEDAQFKFMSALTGQPEMPPRWKRCVERTEAALGDLVGQMFVRERFGGASRDAAEQQIQAIVAAMGATLEGLSWMDSGTRARAKAKLDAMTYQIGYPNKWKTYGFKLDPRAWVANALAARKAERARQLAKIGKPVDRDDWQLSAPQVAAYYDRHLNRMVFPAGILQPPFYSVEASIPVNLGGIGVIVGHELTHAFDDRGAQYDGSGNLVNWWQPDTEQRFKQRTQCVIDQYSRYEVSGNVRLHGASSVGENIADIGGVKLSLAAYRQLRAAAADTVIADGFTEDQQFFLGFGQSMCAKLRPETEQLLATADVHAVPKWRVNGALSATPEFARAFRCRTGSRMVPAKQCVVW